MVKTPDTKVFCMSLPDTLSNIRRIDGGFATAIPEDWMQGRTSYGGFSAALWLTIVQIAGNCKGVLDDLPVRVVCVRPTRE